jgi:hypothetical protein
MPWLALWEEEEEEEAIGVDSTMPSLSSSMICVKDHCGCLPRVTMDGSFDGATSVVILLVNLYGMGDGY